MLISAEFCSVVTVQRPTSLDSSTLSLSLSTDAEPAKTTLLVSTHPPGNNPACSREWSIQNGGSIQTNCSMGSKQRKAVFNARAYRCSGLLHGEIKRCIFVLNVTFWFGFYVI